MKETIEQLHDRLKIVADHWNRCAGDRQPCPDFLAGIRYKWRTWARLRGDGNGSPWKEEGKAVVARCSHEAHYLIDHSSFSIRPKSCEVMKGEKI